MVLTVGAVDRDWPMGEDINLEIDTQTRMEELFRLIAARKSIPKSRFALKIPAFLVAASEANPEPAPADNECVALLRKQPRLSAALPNTGSICALHFTIERRRLSSAVVPARPPVSLSPGIRTPPRPLRFLWEKGKVGGKAAWPVRRCGVYDGLRVVVAPLFAGAWAWETTEWCEANARARREGVREGGEREYTPASVIELRTFKAKQREANARHCILHAPVPRPHSLY